VTVARRSVRLSSGDPKLSISGPFPCERLNVMANVAMLRVNNGVVLEVAETVEPDQVDDTTEQAVDELQDRRPGGLSIAFSLPGRRSSLCAPYARQALVLDRLVSAPALDRA